MDIFESISRPTNKAIEQSQTSSVLLLNPTPTTELPPLATLLLPMINTVEPTLLPPPPLQPKQPAIVFSSNNGFIDDPLIQSLAAEQAASAHNYDLLAHRHKRVSFYF